ncbi:hypothetical protein [Clostridium saccharobutylicum]|uniref:Uncharacterized protein n=1 Tax=Clostridium saccharobutylicum DSM 13864 TaxID=1345695 RepID=U5MTL9_CLOSA|nr:hypothetical protein [Clostridium saccharobutylicum]AGX43910.1 hypothetical protein CLSA_c29430 [Clostridium saccharobutylicum DSM 13864]AQR91207.1 hypothetical protein CLOSC_29310 [Clostridium saccharobutylicum]AQS01111.1 hypothetical protein CSACC_29380 [Clostridium saccharobutylicum]AQS15094.1 hypothetical protein CLOSACC_29380 [Clostridium saccharobutylicum]MBA2905220.1 hypothetical protein [Clostridium saccharobutylicum]
MKNLTTESLKIYTENIGGMVKELVNKKAICLNDEFSKAIYKMSFRKSEEWEVLYMTNSGDYVLHIGVPQDSYVSEIGFRFENLLNECIVVMNEEEAMDYLEYRQCTSTLLEFFSDKLDWDKYEVSQITNCFIKNRKVYDLNRSYCLKAYGEDYIRYGQERCAKEELNITTDERFFLVVMGDSIRVVNPNLYFRAKETDDTSKREIVPITKQEAMKWWVHRTNSRLEEFEFYLNKAKSYLGNID